MCLAGIFSCSADNKGNAKINIKDSCNVANSVVDCLDITNNADTNMLSKKLDTSVKKLLIVFTGRAISGKGLLDKEFLENAEIFKELKKYSIYVLYVDEKIKSKDSLIFDQRNMIYQQGHFNSVVQPHYITYSNGFKECEEHYLNNAENILRFLQCKN